MSRYARKVDDNHRAIVEALEQCGCLVISLAAVGRGVPDLLVLRAGKLFLLEVKDGAKVPSARQLTQQQHNFKKLWPVHVVLTPLDALRSVGLVDMRARVEVNAQRVERTAAALLEQFGAKP